MRLLKCLLQTSFLLSMPVMSGTLESGLLEATACLGTEATVKVMSPSGSCTGTVIRDDVVMTAAHCVDGHKASEIAVTFDRDTRSGAFDVVWAFKKEVHEDYSNPENISYSPLFTQLNDIALLFFVSPLGVLPAHLPNGEIWVGAAVKQEGYGRDETGHSGLLKCATNNIERVGTASIVSDNVCSGDSGGPIYRGNTVYGVVSFSWYPVGASNPCQYEGVYTSVFHQKPWIKSKLNGTPLAEPAFGCGGAVQ